MLFVLVWLYCGICAIEFRKKMTWRPVLTGSESGSGGLADPPFAKPVPAVLLFSFCSIFSKK
jgi:hypothetical protein